jgi:integrase
MANAGANQACNHHDANRYRHRTSEPCASGLTILTGARDRAIASMKLKHVDLVGGSVDQDAREVRTKFGKTFCTYFFPVGEDITQVVAEWIKYLREGKLWGNDDPLFPSTRIALGETRQFEVSGLDKSHWSNTSPIRRIFREAFHSAGLSYFNPHSLRSTLVHLGQNACQTPEQFKAWSQNLGHEKVLTTFMNYGEVECLRQGEIIRGLQTAKVVDTAGMDKLADAVIRKLRCAISF